MSDERPGGIYLQTGAGRFTVWAPEHDEISVHVLDPEERIEPMFKRDRGYHHGLVDGLRPGCRYYYRLPDGRDLPDPASRHQPEGVHGPSALIDHYTFRWEDPAWRGVPLEAYVIYEVHTGTFTPEGTFAGVESRLDDLVDLGVTALELMPVAQFPGERNWGYDGVYPYAVQHSYGGPGGLKKLVNACHDKGLAIILDVVYNHLGPEGNYLGEFGPYFTGKFKTPWGAAVNFDGAGSDEVRRFFVLNAVHWIEEYHFDALRLDAVHGIFDQSARPFLQELAEEAAGVAQAFGRPYYLIAESDLNDPRLVTPRDKGGIGLDASWNDDFHHSVHALLTGERQGYYADFGDAADVAAALVEGYVYSGRYSAYRDRSHGAPAADIPSTRFVVYTQNHDQVGNRMLGDRLPAIVGFEELKLAAGVTMLSASLPLIFMGEEYGETAPFLYFIDHGEKALVEATRKGRREEFAAFGWAGEPPDPKAEETFARSRLNPALRDEPQNAALRALYRELIAVRSEMRPARKMKPPATLPEEDLAAWVEDDVVFFHRRSEVLEALAVFNFGAAEAKGVFETGGPAGGLAGEWATRVDSADVRWLGPGASFPPAPSAGEAFSMPGRSFVLALRGPGGTGRS